MNSDRIKMLEQFVAEDPDDAFNRYALALEWAKIEPRRSTEIFDQLIREQPDYLPAYYQAGLVHLALNEVDRARPILVAGIAVAQQQRNNKTVNELRSLLEALDE